MFGSAWSFFSHHKTGAAPLPDVISKPAWVQTQYWGKSLFYFYLRIVGLEQD